MPLRRESWSHYAPLLALGERRRHGHECGPGNVLMVSRDDKGVSAWCHRCGDGDFIPAAPLPLAERLAALKQAAVAQDVTAESLAPPLPAVPWSDWPTEAHIWLLKAGLGAHDTGKLGAYYHPPTKRVVIPVCDGAGPPISWRARALHGWQIPKYLAPKQATYAVPRWGDGAAVTLTEDMLSAYKVGSTEGCEGWCLLGTNLKTATLDRLMRIGKPVNVWMDPDAAGQRAASKIGKQLRAVGISVTNIVSQQDPKKIHRSTIKEMLCGK